MNGTSLVTSGLAGQAARVPPCTGQFALLLLRGRNCASAALTGCQHSGEATDVVFDHDVCSGGRGLWRSCASSCRAAIHAQATGRKNADVSAVSVLSVHWSCWTVVASLLQELSFSNT